jgi:serine/threonine-protein kinase
MGGKLIGDRYRPVERHAVGGMATLWRARDERTGERVAIKRLHPYLVADPRARARLVREAAALKAIDHPSITRPREVIDDPDDPALVMEFAEGRSLKDRLAEDGPLDPDEAVAIAGTVADALAVAHSAGIVHRDIKPGNILVEDSGAIHLVDFGIATLTAGDDAGSDLTATGTMVGTARYAAPERLTGGESTARSDVWGLGAVLYEMLSGRPAVGGDGVTAPSTELTRRPPDTDDLPAGLASIVRRAMAPDPADRYPDAAAFRDALFASDGAIDPLAETAIVPLAAAAAVPIAGAVAVSPVGAPADGVSAAPPGSTESALPSTSPPRRLDLSSVDRAAAVFFGGVGAITLAALVALGVGGPGPSAEPSPSPPAPAIQPAASPIDAEVTPSPDDDGRGRGRGEGNGKGKGRGNDNDDD